MSFSIELTEPGGAHAEFGCKVGGEVRVIGKTAKFADFVNGHIGVLQQRFCIVHSVTHDAWLGGKPRRVFKFVAEVVKGIAVGLAVVLQVDLIEEVVIQKVNGLRDKSLYMEKYHKTDIAPVENENERDETYQAVNPQIDFTRTRSNYNIIKRQRSYTQFIRDYLLSEQWQKDYAEWKSRQLNTKLNKISDWNHTDAAISGRERNYAK